VGGGGGVCGWGSGGGEAMEKVAGDGEPVAGTGEPSQDVDRTGE